jgi:hypothetical protein
MSGDEEVNGYDVFENEIVTPAEPEPPAEDEE